MHRSCLSGLLAAVIGVIGVTQAASQQACKPVLGFRDVRFSAMQPPTMERKWTAVLSVDASRCAADSGGFEILFVRLKENGPEVEFREKFTWQLPSVTVSVDFWADEAVEGYWLDNIAACPCRR